MIDKKAIWYHFCSSLEIFVQLVPLEESDITVISVMVMMTVLMMVVIMINWSKVKPAFPTLSMASLIFTISHNMEWQKMDSIRRIVLFTFLTACLCSFTTIILARWQGNVIFKTKLKGGPAIHFTVKSCHLFLFVLFLAFNHPVNLKCSQKPC